MSKTYSGYSLHGKMTFQGLPISIENERGSVRRGEDKDGHEWATFMHYPYGYIRLTEGVDGDHVDCYIGTNHSSIMVFIIHQQDPKTKKYDEDKVMLGFNSAADAKRAYLRQYDSPGFYQSMTIVTMSRFKDMLKERFKKKLETDRLDSVDSDRKNQIAEGELPVNSDQVLSKGKRLVILHGRNIDGRKRTDIG
jgi:hypothetical protein